MIVLITLLAIAAMSLRGHIPGATQTSDHQSTPSALAVALMPVLLTVSVVILLAGVIASQHRLPLAMPEPERGSAEQRWRLGKFGLLILAVLAGFSLLIAAATALIFVGRGRETTTATTAPPSGSPRPTGEIVTTAPAPNPAGEPAQLTGIALWLAVVAAGVLVAVALVGLVVVAMTARGKPATVPAPPPPAAPTTGSLARAAEMGLAAMNVPGQDPRTAIIACYVAMENGLSFDRSAAPLASDTPMEVLARAFERGALHDASARELVALFEEARFSPHSMLEWQRMRAEQLLRIVLADLQGEMV
ncbi:DUF4129 domain-containing protein [Nocardia australiensis]|uniref:DUF4129 domain-containing protein n=1 Tax=Nocardia australiensis TaxID=2887191 RepID=UPI001D148AD7|nr:DUF4129 domain-containing protein [Nocardia australiensis]